MEYVLICIVALIGSGLTLFSGFGLGTLLVPVFAIFFPIEIAISLTAIVHFLNNLFKLTLLGKHADKSVILRFGIPAIISAFIGAYVLTLLTGMHPLFHYSISGRTFEVMPVKLTIAILLIVFALFDVIPRLENLQFSPKYLPVGGLLSGFFGGLSGNQGALRTAFLIRANLSKEAFIATGVVIACLIDVSRLTVYTKQIIEIGDQFNYTLIIAATLSAFLGAYIGNKVLKKITVKTLQYIVAGMLFIFAVLLGAGII
ncbi:MAG: sulfite exporter TauE/SafE family protein [Bacteroidia bacterium]|nr:sulfite exporter TauE/SafE family protein [Bacteroidia bacterium]